MNGARQEAQRAIRDLQTAASRLQVWHHCPTPSTSTTCSSLNNLSIRQSQRHMLKPRAWRMLEQHST